MIIAIDFDGTCVTHEFPKIGDDIGAIPVLKQLVKNGHKLILLTMRGFGLKAHECRNGNTYYGDTLQDAINWFRENDIPLYGINENPKQHLWTSSNKVFANIYIDDQALGAPIKQGHIDWEQVSQMLNNYGLL